MSNFIKENFLEDLNYCEKKNKIKINILSDNLLVIHEYIINFQNKSKKIIDKIDSTIKLKNLNDMEVRTKDKNSNKKIKSSNFKQKNFYKKKFFKKVKSSPSLAKKV